MTFVKYLKKWCGLPPSATNAMLHMKAGMDIKTISQLFMEAHSISHTRTRLLGDPAVNFALDCGVARESELTGKRSTIVTAENNFQKALNYNSVQGEIPMFGERWEKEARQFREDVKETVKMNITFEDENKWREHVKTLVIQGRHLELASAEHSDAIWKSFVFDMKKGTLKFLLNA